MNEARVILQVGISGKSFISVPAEKEAVYRRMLDAARETGTNISAYNFKGEAYPVTREEALAAGFQPHDA